jgi:hypothetical protein
VASGVRTTRVRRRTTTGSVSMRTATRRAKIHEADLAEKARIAKAKANEPETLGQARTWDRKYVRYQLAGLCDVCAAQAAYGHAEGFQKIHDPCAVCQPLVNLFPTAGPKGSKWRKILDKVERFDEEQLAVWIDAH